MIVLGIETSCDETSVALIEKKKYENSGRVLSENTFSQINKHKIFGGVVPELASREHSKIIHKLVKQTISDSNISLNEIDGFAATMGPGLLGGLLVGSNYAKTLALSENKPFLSINHLQGHILVSRMKKNIAFPFLCLLVSGGHTQLLVALNFNKFKLLGETLDDALGEAFDKTAKIMGFDYPGGPIIEKLALKSKKNDFFKLPRPLINERNCDFSFSGLKTSVRKTIENGISKNLKNDLANEFQNSVTECLLAKTERAINFFKKNYGAGTLVFSGGVASNKFIRSNLKTLCKKMMVEFIVPESSLCVDNATMIAWAGIEKLENGEIGDSLNLPPKPKWDLQTLC
ncbi:MAG: tRNA (adenosine(37)-N6)-threonylcarbamoyltransferase complex transferase subunit TsaD [Rickettsiales bacterium]|nr:tRNA (adenosine(37)-N6)-threonylcarbamoyltransferase complex transferase subunit TsaD [Rickettsiales bacterium]